MQAPLLPLLVLLAAAPPGAPHPLVKPYEGSTVQTPATPAEFTRVDVAVRDAQGNLTAQPVEGRVVRAKYLGPAGRSPLEVFRNYQEGLERAGFQVRVACIAQACGRSHVSAEFGLLTARGSHYLAAEGRVDGEGPPVWVMVRVFERQASVVSVQPRAMEGDKVQVTAAALAQGLEAQGHVAVYGLVFDTGRAELKPESTPVLEQIAQLLAQQPALKLHVVGHTDNVGAYAANLELSRRRAASVVAALTARHGVAAARLHAEGVGPLVPVATNASADGRAKNRRVDLVQQ